MPFSPELLRTRDFARLNLTTVLADRPGKRGEKNGGTVAPEPLQSGVPPPEPTGRDYGHPCTLPLEILPAPADVSRPDGEKK